MLRNCTTSVLNWACQQIFNLYKELFTTEHMSTYNKSTLELESKFPMGPMTGYFDNNDVCNIAAPAWAKIVWINS